MLQRQRYLKGKGINRIIYHGDVIDKLLQLEDESIDCSVWSPPYFGLRDYGVEGQWGLEANLGDYLKNLYHVMFILKQKLKPTGTCWVNLGDKYVSNPVGKFNGGGEEFEGRDMSGIESSGKMKTKHLGFEPKTRLGIPERFYVDCIDSGWIARNHIVWYKNNPMPSSVKDRFTNMWESMFFFTKSHKYYFNLDAVRVPTKGKYELFNVRVRDANKDRFIQKDTDKEKKLKQDGVIDPATGRPKGTYKGFNDRWKNLRYKGQQPHTMHKLRAERKWELDHGQGIHTMAKKHSGVYDKETGKLLNHPKGKNPGDAWMFNTQPFPESHFATFPEKLVTRILHAGCPPNGVVLDPFFGAGTTGLVAERLGMQWLGIELKKEYIDMAVRRIKKESDIEIDIK